VDEGANALSRFAQPLRRRRSKMGAEHNEGVIWISTARDRDQRGFPDNTIMNLRVLQQAIIS
jgi:hypothetical protein